MITTLRWQVICIITLSNRLRPLGVGLYKEYGKLSYIYALFLQVRLGAEYTTDGRIIRPVGGAPTGIVTFSPYIRPVCLPCSPDSCVAKVLKKPDQRGQVLLKGNETAEEKCRIECN